MSSIPTPSLLGEVLERLPRSQWLISNEVAKAFLTCPRLHYINSILCSREGVDESRHEDVLRDAWLTIIAPDETGTPKIFGLNQSKDSIYSYMWMFIFYSVRSMQSRNRVNDHRHDLSGSVDSVTNSESSEKYISHLKIDNGTTPKIDEEVVGKISREKPNQNWKARLSTKSWLSLYPRDTTHYIRLGRPCKIDQETPPLDLEASLDLDPLGSKLEKSIKPKMPKAAN